MGGKGLLNQYNGNVTLALKNIYPSLGESFESNYYFIFYFIFIFILIVKKTSKPESILNEILKEITKVRIFYIIY